MKRVILNRPHLLLVAYENIDSSFKYFTILRDWLLPLLSPTIGTNRKQWIYAYEGLQNNVRTHIELIDKSQGAQGQAQKLFLGYGLKMDWGHTILHFWIENIFVENDFFLLSLNSISQFAIFGAWPHALMGCLSCHMCVHWTQIHL